MAKAKKTDSHFGEKLLKHREAIAAEFNIADISDWRVRRLALHEAQFASLEDLFAAGRPVDTGQLLQLDQSIQDIRQPLKANEPIEAHLKILRRVVGVFTCQHCHQRNEIEDYKRPDPPPAPTPQAVYARPVDEAQKPASEPAKPAEEPGKPHVTHRAGVSASRFHSQVINGVAAPLKKDEPSPYVVRKVSPLGG